MKTIKQLVMLLIVGAVLLGLTNVTNMAADTYEEENIGKIKTYTRTKSISGDMDMKYEGDSLNFSYQNFDYTSDMCRVKELIYSRDNQKSSSIIYSGEELCMGYGCRKPIKSYKKNIYRMEPGARRENIVIYIHNKKSKKIKSYEIDKFVDKSPIKDDVHYRVLCDEIKKLTNNKVQILYKIQTYEDEFIYGGLAIINLKEKSVERNMILDFAPMKSDKKYIYGSSYDDVTGTEKIHIASYKTGETIKTYSTDYGIDQTKTYQFSGIENTKIKFIPTTNEKRVYRKYYYANSYDFRNGHVILQNYSGIYYGGVKEEGLEKLMNVEDLPYYSKNYTKRGWYDIALKDKGEFTIAYCDTYDDPCFWLKRYVMK